MGAGRLPTILDSSSVEEREKNWREEKDGRRRGVPAEGGWDFSVPSYSCLSVMGRSGV